MHPLAGELEGIVDAGSIRTARYDPLVRTPFYRTVPVPDEWRQGDPFTVVTVKTAEEISRILRLANERREPVYVRQGMGVVSPDVVRPEPPGSLVIDVGAMSWIRPNYERSYVEVGPSVTEKALNRELAPQGYAYPELIGPVTWVGSLVSLNSSGRSVDPYIGKPRDYVIGLEGVLPTGEIINTGTTAPRGVCGFDVGQLLIGGQCLFGVVTDVRLRLIPAAREIKGALVQYPSLRVLGEAVGSVYRSRAPYPRLMELMDRNFLEVLGFDGPRPPAAQLVAVDGNAPGEADWKLGETIRVLEEAGATESYRATSEEWQNLIDFREGLLTQMNPKGLILLTSEVMDCPLDVLPDALEGMHELQARMAATYPDIQPVLFGHIGAGSCHPTFIAPVSWGYQRIREIAKIVRDQVLEFKLSYGATIGEQGIFPEHRGWFLGSDGDVSWKALLAVKGALDPNNILNPLRLTDMQDA